MGSKSETGSSLFSRQVVEAIKRLRAEMGLSNAELISASQFGQNKYYTCLRGDSAFDTDDLDSLGRALGVNPGEIVAVAVEILPDELEPDGALARVDPRELGRRVNFLETNGLPAGRAFALPLLLDSIDRTDAAFGAEEWLSLTSGSAPGLMSIRLLASIASYFSVPTEYLTNTASSETSSRIEAKVELDRAIFDSGATGVAARSFGNTSADELRAIAEVIRSIK